MRLGHKVVLALTVAAAIALCSWVQPAGCADILAVFPMEGTSHWIVFRELLLELSRRGHRLTVLAHFQEHVPNWEPLHLKAKLGDDADFDFVWFGSLSAREQFMALFQGGIWFCHKLMEDEAVLSLVHSRDRKFDLLIIETFFNECLLPLAHKFRAPVVGACALGGGTSWMNAIVGNPYPLAYVPDATLPYGSRMGILQRGHNAFVALSWHLQRQYVYLPALDQIVQKHFKDPSMPPIAELERNTSLLLLNTHFSFDYSRPFVPNAVQVAGMHITPPKKLPKDLQIFMDTATYGVVYFSLGSAMKSANLPTGLQDMFLKVFSNLAEKVLWKFETDSLPNLPPNVKINKWFPQSDILAHKNMKLFITHGGLMSMEEAIYFGVPLLGVPIFGDQEANLLKAQDSRYGIMLRLNNITEESFGWAINEMLTEERYTQNAKKYSRLFHDRPEPPLETAVRWIEYVLRHRGARHLRSAALDLSGFQLLLLDVLLVPLLAAVAAALAVACVLRAVCCRTRHKVIKRE